MQVSFIHSIHQVEPGQWDSLWNSDYPFTHHAFLAALEDSGSTRTDTGWRPMHALVKREGRLVAAMPLFEKNHSYGEYVFDWAWADAYAQQRLNYYPKLVNAIPFTPATGPRIAVAAGIPHSEKAALMQELQQQIKRRLQAEKGSGWHCLFPDAGSRALLEGLPLVARYGFQFHWFNHGYRDFEDFLGTFSSRKRKNLNKERRRVADAGLVLQTRQGDQVSEEDWRLFYTLYQGTYLKRSGHYGYLGPSFFQRLAQAMPEQILLVSAHSKEGKMVAGAFYLRDQHTLYGRYWGALEEYDGLHFEACYYQGIEYAIAHKLSRFDPGAQGEHKIQRGFTPIQTCSYHWLADSRFQHAIADFCKREAAHVLHYIEGARTALPFREEIPLAPVDVLLQPEQNPAMAGS